MAKKNRRPQKQKPNGGRGEYVLNQHRQVFEDSRTHRARSRAAAKRKAIRDSD